MVEAGDRVRRDVGELWNSASLLRDLCFGFGLSVFVCFGVRSARREETRQLVSCRGEMKESKKRGKKKEREKQQQKQPMKGSLG